MNERRGSQRDRILSWALAGNVVHQDDWYNAGADGGSAIKAVRSRISELEVQGSKFNHTRRADGTTEYTFAAYVSPRPVEPREALPAPDWPDDPGLFDAAYEMDQRPASYRDWDSES